MTERLWQRAVVWLAFLGPFFFLSYGWANAYAASLPAVPTLAFSWEKYVPFLAWSILPYWSTDLLYAVSLFVCRSREELDQHGWRLLAVQVFSVACFFAFPLRYSYERPELSGWTGFLFSSLANFDQPFNEAPSLHVSLSVILWSLYRRHASGLGRRLLGLWILVAALSSWTTYQHQFLDLVLGAWTGLLVVAAIPAHRPWPRPHRLAGVYLTASLALLALALWLQGWFWFLLWPSFSLSMVAAAYASGNPAWLGKKNGRLPPWMWPYAAGAWLNSRAWTRNIPARNLLVDGVWIGRAPSAADRAGMASVLDLSAEMPVDATISIPVLDLSGLSPKLLDEAVASLEALAGARPTLVCCALGFSRSATVGAAWLLATGRASSVDAAIEAVRAARPQVRISERQKLLLQEWSKTLDRRTLPMSGDGFPAP